jgi:hypothetical protein
MRAKVSIAIDGYLLDAIDAVAFNWSLKRSAVIECMLRSAAGMDVDPRHKFDDDVSVDVGKVWMDRFVQRSHGQTEEGREV